MLRIYVLLNLHILDGLTKIKANTRLTYNIHD